MGMQKQIEETPTREELESYRFLDYRLNQIEQNLKEGQQRLEKESYKQNKQIITILNNLQKQAITNQENISLLKQKVASLELDTNNIEKLSETAHINSTKIEDLERRLDIYKTLLLTIGAATASSILMGVIQLLH